MAYFRVLISEDIDNLRACLENDRKQTYDHRAILGDLRAIFGKSLKSSYVVCVVIRSFMKSENEIFPLHHYETNQSNVPVGVGVALGVVPISGRTSLAVIFPRASNCSSAERLAFCNSWTILVFVVFDVGCNNMSNSTPTLPGKNLMKMIRTNKGNVLLKYGTKMAVNSTTSARELGELMSLYSSTNVLFARVTTTTNFLSGFP